MVLITCDPTEYHLRVIFMLFAGPADLSASSDVVLISTGCSVDLSASSGCGTHFRVASYPWVVRDLSAASAVVLISLHDSASSECGLRPVVLITCDPTEYHLRVIFMLFAGPADLSASSDVVLISTGGQRRSECILRMWYSFPRCIYAWVVRDLSAASAVVLISLHDSAGSECGLRPVVLITCDPAEYYLRVIFMLFAGPGDLSASSDVVLISTGCSVDLSASSGCGTHFRGASYAWVVRDLSAASAVVLISLHDSAGSECGLRPVVLITCDPAEYYLRVVFMLFAGPGDLSASSDVVLISTGCQRRSECILRMWYSFPRCIIYVGRQGSECSLGCGTHFSARFRRF